MNIFTVVLSADENYKFTSLNLAMDLFQAAQKGGFPEVELHEESIIEEDTIPKLLEYVKVVPNV